MNEVSNLFGNGSVASIKTVLAAALDVDGNADAKGDNGDHESNGNDHGDLAIIFFNLGNDGLNDLVGGDLVLCAADLAQFGLFSSGQGFDNRPLNLCVNFLANIFLRRVLDLCTVEIGVVRGLLLFLGGVGRLQLDCASSTDLTSTGTSLAFFTFVTLGGFVVLVHFFHIIGVVVVGVVVDVVVVIGTADTIVNVLATRLANVDITVEVDLVHILAPLEHFEAQLDLA